MKSNNYKGVNDDDERREMEEENGKSSLLLFIHTKTHSLITQSFVDRRADMVSIIASYKVYLSIYLVCMYIIMITAKRIRA